MGVAELLQDRRVRRQGPLRRPLTGLQAELVVEDLAELRRRVEVELAARVPVHVGLERRHVDPDRRPHLLEVRHVETDPARLHVREHR